MYSEKKGPLLCRIVIYLIFPVLITGLLASCNSSNIPVTVFPTNSPTQIRPSGTSTPLPTLILPTLTPHLSAVITATPTVAPLAALASEFNIPQVCLFTNSYIISNDHGWLGVDCKSSQELIIANKSSGNKTIVRYQDLDKEAPNNFSVRPLSWSSDSQYFYFTTRCCDYNDTYNHNGSLYRFDNQSEKWDVLIHSTAESYYYFSESGERYIFINQYPRDQIEIGMADTLDNKNKRVVLKYYWVRLERVMNFHRM